MEIQVVEGDLLDQETLTLKNELYLRWHFRRSYGTGFFVAEPPATESRTDG
jgi:hypothetical protein